MTGNLSSKSSTAILLLLLIWAVAAQGQDSLTGTWTAEREGDGFRITLSARYSHRNHTTFLLSHTLPPDRFDMEIDRDAGRITLDGRRQGDQAAGFFTFWPKSAFNEVMKRIGYGSFDLDELFLLTGLAAQRSEIERLPGLGYPDLSTDELLAMHIHGALVPHIVELKRRGYDHLPVEDLLSTRIHDVTPEFIDSVRALGYEQVTLEELVSMRIHGVTAAYIQAVNEALGEAAGGTNK